MKVDIQADTSPGMVEVSVDAQAVVHHALDDAIARVREATVRHNTGIVTTRTGPGRYIVGVHPSVPIGLIRQQHD